MIPWYVLACGLVGLVVQFFAGSSANRRSPHSTVFVVGGVVGFETRKIVLGGLRVDFGVGPVLVSVVAVRGVTVDDGAYGLVKTHHVIFATTGFRQIAAYRGTPPKILGLIAAGCWDRWIGIEHSSLALQKNFDILFKIILMKNPGRVWLKAPKLNS